MTHHVSLFGHLVTHFTSHPENLATEALNFVLGRSAAARQAFVQYLGHAGIEAHTALSFQTQAVGTDTAIPDLVGLDDAGVPVVIGEAKFWAGLTEHQPLTYVRRLPTDRASVLLFIAPGARFSTLWPELQHRCLAGGVSLGQTRSVGTEFVVGELGGMQTLALTSWRAVLEFILQAVAGEGHNDAVADLVQLQGLCNRMDDEAFLLLRSEELTGDSGRRVAQFCDLVDDVVRRAVAAGLADVKSLRQGSGSAYYGRYLRLGGRNAFLAVNARRWGRLRATPLWLSFLDEKWKWRVVPELRTLLLPLEQQTPPRLLIDDGHLTVPVTLPLAAERDDVADAVLEQLREVAGYLTSAD